MSDSMRELVRDQILIYNIQEAPTEFLKQTMDVITPQIHRTI